MQLFVWRTVDQYHVKIVIWFVCKYSDFWIWPDSHFTAIKNQRSNDWPCSLFTAHWSHGEYMPFRMFLWLCLRLASHNKPFQRSDFRIIFRKAQTIHAQRFIFTAYTYCSKEQTDLPDKPNFLCISIHCKPLYIRPMCLSIELQCFVCFYFDTLGNFQMNRIKA